MNKTTKNEFEIVKLENFPENANPFEHDLVNMGTQIGQNVLIMHSNHTSECCKKIIIVDIPSGKRISVIIPQNKEE